MVAAYDDTALDELWKINLGTPFNADFSHY
jgi:hypothetical protein